MNDPVGAPGIGGSLGQCSLCGGNFVFEILMGKPVASITVDGCKQTLFAHAACLKKYGVTRQGGVCDATTLPPESPLRQAYERNLAPQPAPVEPMT